MTTNGQSFETTTVYTTPQWKPQGKIFITSGKPLPTPHSKLSELVFNDVAQNKQRIVDSIVRRSKTPVAIIDCENSVNPPTRQGLDP